MDAVERVAGAHLDWWAQHGRQAGEIAIYVVWLIAVMWLLIALSDRMQRPR